MFDGLADRLAEAVQGNPWVAPLAALLGGLLTAANPCVLAMVPLMIGYVAGQSTETKRHALHSFVLSLAFSLGLTITFGVLFLATWAASSVLNAAVWSYVAGAVCLLMGCHLLGVLRFELPAPKAVTPQRRGLLGALLLGLLFGLVSLPCAGPVLLALLAVVPLKGVAFGAVLLVAYSIGHCALILVGGTSIGLVQRMADAKGWNRWTQVLRQVAGVLIVLVGLWILFLL